MWQYLVCVRNFYLILFQDAVFSLLFDIISVSGECMHFKLNKKHVKLLQVEHPLCQLFWLVLVVQQLKRAQQWTQPRRLWPLFRTPWIINLTSWMQGISVLFIPLSTLFFTPAKSGGIRNDIFQGQIFIFPTFPECFPIPIFFSNLNPNCSNLLQVYK